MEVLFYSKLLIGEKRDVYFFRKEDISKLENILNDSFRMADLSTIEKYKKVLDECPDDKESKSELIEFTNLLFYENAMTISYIDFAKTLLESSDLRDLTNKDVKIMLKLVKPIGSDIQTGMIVKIVKSIINGAISP